MPTRHLLIRTLVPAALALALPLVAAGCDSSQPHSLAGSAPTSQAAPSDLIPASRAWRDLDAAVSSACSEAGVAVLRSSNPSAGVRRYDSLTITDQQGVLTATAPAGYIDPDSPVARPVPIDQTRLECAIGGSDAALRDPDREDAFVKAIRAWRPKFLR